MTEWANEKEKWRQRFRKRVRGKILKRDNITYDEAAKEVG